MADVCLTRLLVKIFLTFFIFIITAIMLIPEMLGEKSDGLIRVYDVSFKTI
jgi:hypothetical protein